MLCVRRQSGYKRRSSWPNRPRFSRWGIRHWISGKCIFSSRTRNRLYFDGHRRLVLGTCTCTKLSNLARYLMQSMKSGIAQGGGLTQTYRSSAEQYNSGFSLALRMVSVAAGVTIGLFVSQVIGKCGVSSFQSSGTQPGSVYLFGTRKNAAHFAF